MLISGAEAIDARARMSGHGVTGEIRIDWRDLMRFKRGFTSAVPGHRERSFAEKGIETFHGVARFASEEIVVVEGRELGAKHVLIAAGARPALLNIPGEEYAATSEQFLELENLPARIILVGGGYIAAEFSHIAARAGAAVTVFQRADRMLPVFDPDLVSWLGKKFAELGIEVHTRTTVERIDRKGEAFVVLASTDGRHCEIEADLVVKAAGREPDLDGLDLAAGRIASEGGRLKLNEYLQSVSNPKVYAAGDAAGSGPPLTPVSSHDGRVVAHNLLEGNKLKPNYRGVPSVAFTVPPIAAVGLSEAEARAKGIRFRIRSELVPNWYTARRLNESIYGFKTLIDEDSDRILGAHLVGPHAEEVINIFGLAIRHGLRARDLKSTIFAYPTGASDIGYML
jgi:glutathione reductase (NADPH)